MATAAYNSKIYATSPPSVSFANEGTTDVGDHTTFTITDQTKRYLTRDDAVVVQAAHDEVQTVSITGAPTGGSFTLTFGANTTAAIAYNALASQVQSALQALASIGSGNALVTGAVGGPYTVRFTGTLGLAGQSLLTKDATGLTGGSSPNVAIARVQAGGSFATISSGFKLYRVNARVTFTAAQPVGTQVRLSSGKYLPVMQIGEAANGDFAGKMDTTETTIFTTTGTKRFLPTLLSGTFKASTFWVNTTYTQMLTDRDLLVVAFDVAGGDKYEGYCYVGDSSLKGDQKSAITEDLTFQLTDEFFNS